MVASKRGEQRRRKSSPGVVGSLVLACESSKRRHPDSEPRAAPRAPRRHLLQAQTELPRAKAARPAQTSSSDAPTPQLLPACASRPIHRCVSAPLECSATLPFHSTSLPSDRAASRNRQHPARKTKSTQPARPTDRPTARAPTCFANSLRLSCAGASDARENGQSRPQSHTPRASAPPRAPSPNSPPPQSRLAASRPCPAA